MMVIYNYNYNIVMIIIMINDNYSNYYILVKVPCDCITGNIARGRGQESIKHEAQPSALFARDHSPSTRLALIMPQ